MAASRQDVYYIEVVGRALDVLEVFAHEQHAQLSLKDIAQRLNQSMNTTFRLLYTLVEHGYVTKKNKKYDLGPKLLDLTTAKLRQTDLIQIAGPYMDALRERFRETVNLGVLMEAQVRYIAVRESLEKFRLAEVVGGSDPLHCTALGKVCLAYLPFSDVRQLVRSHGMRRFTDRTITSLSALEAELKKVRSRGFAVDAQESMLGGFCIAAAILDSQGAPVAAISISGPHVRFNESHVGAVVPALREAAESIERDLRLPGRVTPKHAAPESISSAQTTRRRSKFA